MMRSHERELGVDLRNGWTIVVDVGGAQALLREVFFRQMPGVIVSSDSDELFRLDGIPIRLRYGVPYGSAFCILERQVPERSCCDATAMSTLLCCMSRGDA